MKTYLIGFAAVIFSLVSCQNEEKKQNDAHEEIENSFIEKETNQLSGVKSEKTSDYIIAEGKVGHLRTQDDEIRLNPGETLIHETRNVSEEGIDYEVEIEHILGEFNDTLISIDNYGFWIFSSDYHTESGLHINKRLTDVFEMHADAKIFYSYVNGMFWIEIESFEGVEFAIESSAYKGESDVLMQSDLIEVDPQFMDKFAKITKIRVY